MSNLSNLKKLAALLFSTSVISASAQNTDVIHCAAEPITFAGLTKKLSDVSEASFFIKEIIGKKKHEDEERAKSEAGMVFQKTESSPDGALQTQYKSEGPSASINVLSSFSGLKSGYLRSDNNIAVGPDHVVQITNSNITSSLIRVWDKSGNVLVKRKYMSELTGTPDYGDPNIIYDQQADRYVISFLYSARDWKLILCCSQTSDPTGAYYMYVFDTPGGFPDYEKVSVWGDSYIICAAKPGYDVFVINRIQVLSGGALQPVLMFDTPKLPTIGWQSCSPIHQIGALDAPANEPKMIMRVVDDAWYSHVTYDQLHLFALTINWNDPGSSTMSSPISLPIEPYNSDLCGFNSNRCLPQPGTIVKLWPCSDFIMDKAKYMNFGDHESIVGSHVCSADGAGTAGVRWYELRKENGSDWYIYQQGTYSPTDDDRFMSSITINDQGTIALGYNITSKVVYPGIRVTGRAACDDLNQMTVPEEIVKAGAHANATLDYGDYNGIVTDPVDGSFWFTAQFNKTAKWSTNVVHFTISACEDSVQKPAASNAIYHQDVSVSDFKLSPNPADEKLSISFSSTKDFETQLLIFDVAGRKVFQMPLSIHEGVNDVTVATDLLQNGYYIIQLDVPANTLNCKLVVQH